MRTPLLLVVWSVSVLVGCAQPMTGGSPETRGAGIVGGTPTTGWDSVVFLFTGGGACTGVVVAPQVVLTAGHCLEGVSGTVDVYWGDDLIDGVYEYARHSNDYHIYPHYDPADYSGDIAALGLSEVSPTDPIPINCDPPDASWVDPTDPLTGVGFGTIYPDPGSGGVKLEAPIAFDSWDSDFLYHSDPDHGFCNGDGGAPVLTDHGGDWAVAAVASHGDAHCVGFGAATRTDQHVDWLEGLFPGWDVCGDGDDDDATGDDDSAGDDDTTGDDDTSEEEEDDDIPPDCGCRHEGGTGRGGAIALAVVVTLALSIRRRPRP